MTTENNPTDEEARMDEDFYKNATTLFAEFDRFGVDMSKADIKKVVGAVFEFWKKTMDSYEAKINEVLDRS